MWSLPHSSEPVQRGQDEWIKMDTHECLNPWTWASWHTGIKPLLSVFTYCSVGQFRNFFNINQILNQYHITLKAKNVQLHNIQWELVCYVTTGVLRYNLCAMLQLACYVTTVVLQDQLSDNLKVVTELVKVTKYCSNNSVLLTLLFTIFEVLTPVMLKTQMFWDVMPCDWASSSQWHGITSQNIWVFNSTTAQQFPRC